MQNIPNSKTNKFRLIIKMFFAIFLLIQIVIVPQWKYISTINSFEGAKKVCMITDNITVIICEKGLIGRTTDNGRTWNSIPTHAFSNLNDILFYKGILFVVGEHGTVLRSSDKGESWQLSFIGEDKTLFSLANNGDYSLFVSAENGILFYSKDIGITWQKVITTVVGYNLTSIKFSGGLIGYSLAKNISGALLLKSTGEGTNWETLELPGSMQSIEDMFVINDSTVLLSDGRLFRSTNYGKTWVEQKYIDPWTPINSRYYQPLSNTSGIRASYDKIFKTTDAGNSWIEFPVRIKGNILNLSFLNSNSGYCMGLDGSVYYTSDGGNTWSLREGKYQFARPLSFIDDKIITLSDNSFSIDGGDFWSIYSGVSGYNLNALRDGQNNLWFCQNSGTFPNYKSSLLKSTDNGKTLNEYLVVNNNIFAMFKHGDNYIFLHVVGPSMGKGLYRLNVITGEFKAVIYPESLIKFISDKDGKIFVLDVNKIYSSEDGGSTWAVSNLPSIKPIDMCVDNKGVIFVLHEGGVLNTSTDKGNSWNSQIVTAQFPLGGITSGLGKIWIYDSYGTLLRNEDSFNSWKKVYVPKGLVISNLLFSKELAIVYGGSNVIVIVRNILSDNSSHENSDTTKKNTLPTRFLLSQNYPNPFNPSTTINYQTISAGNVTLKVYDLLGREISTLVNETKSPGSYEATFNGASLPSGIYFYTMQAGSFTETKKFVLMK